MAGLDDHLRAVVGGRTAAALEAELGLSTVHQLLHHLPRRYERRGTLTDLSELQGGEHVTVLAEVREVHTRPMRTRKGTLTEVTVTDGRSILYLTFFQQKWRAGQLTRGTRGLFSGQVRAFRSRRELTHPACHLFDAADSDLGAPAAEAWSEQLIAVYPATGKLASWRIGAAVKLVLGSLDPVADPLPESLRRRHDLPGLAEAFELVHRPPTASAAALARLRLTWDEAMVLQTVLARRRRGLISARACPRAPRTGGLRDAFDASLPFRLTAGQERVGAEIDADLGAGRPMQRLLQGEVGSGKTVVALRSMLTVVDAGGQAVLLAPTEVLAVQHARTISRLLGPLGQAGQLDAAEQATALVLLTGSATPAERRRALTDIRDGRAGVVVGTHALLHAEVGFADLGLVVVDEQHRFGVEQRDALRRRSQDGTVAHLLVMTATPIPRTVALTAFGDLDVSTLSELPAGRGGVSSHVVEPRWNARAWERVREEVAAGHQAFVVFPRIGAGLDGPAEGGAAPAAPGERAPVALLDSLPELTGRFLPGLRVGVLHGRLPAEDKDRVMSAFAAGHFDVLASTTVIEVGVDVPNATVMIVLDAERFGVSQLHQLRGRIGRGSAPGLCLLLSAAVPGGPAHRRLQAVAGTTDGAVLAELDLQQRREGDLLGSAQSGASRSLKLLKLLNDGTLLEAAQAAAGALVQQDPDLVTLPGLRAAVDRLQSQAGAEYLDTG